MTKDDKLVIKEQINQIIEVIEDIEDRCIAWTTLRYDNGAKGYGIAKDLMLEILRRSLKTYKEELERMTE